jgi:hypothetical protein
MVVPVNDYGRLVGAFLLPLRILKRDGSIVMSNIFDALRQAEAAVAERKHRETAATSAIEEVDLRRTCRTRIPISLFVYGYTPQNAPFVEQAYTIEINAHGALISMTTAVSLGARLLLTNETNQRSLACTVLAVTARQGRDAEVAVAFDTPAPQFRSPLP